ncbi:MAG: hypothetical protein ACRDQZ_14950 [Mycobacteriales bacterium]
MVPLTGKALLGSMSSDFGTGQPDLTLTALTDELGNAHNAALPRSLALRVKESREGT